MLDAIATIILAGMMFIPIINLVVGIIAGACMFGFSGGIAGAALAFLITIAQKQMPGAILAQFTSSLVLGS